MPDCSGHIPFYIDMMMVKHYKVAGFTFSVCFGNKEHFLTQMRQYDPFVSEDTTDAPIFTLDIIDQSIDLNGLVYDGNQNEDGQEICVGHIDDHLFFEFRDRGRVVAQLLCSQEFHEGQLYVISDYLFGVNNALMTMFMLATSDKQTALFHSSVVSHDAYGYMFLGKSGTGKSTHAQLWLKHIPNTTLVNDDNPVVRIIEGKPYVYGSPWSGKTPCYRNELYPLGGIVRLRQAPFNKIRRLNPLEAYSVIMPAVSGVRWVKALASGIHETETILARIVPVWYLDCLPDEAAARLCYEACVNNQL